MPKPRQRTLALVTAVAAVALTGAVVVAARSGDWSAAAPATASAVPPVRVVVPGRPGESATVTDSDRIRGPAGFTYNAADTAFVQMMIVHHGSALERAARAPERAANAGVRALAARVAAAQKPEVAWLRAWLKARGRPADPAGHDHSTMPGMPGRTELAALTAARGADFDRLFVDLLTAHHLGAVQMAGDVLRGGSDELLAQTANEMAAEQGAEIRRMEQLTLG